MWGFWSKEPSSSLRFQNTLMYGTKLLMPQVKPITVVHGSDDVRENFRQQQICSDNVTYTNVTHVGPNHAPARMSERRGKGSALFWVKGSRVDLPQNRPFGILILLRKETLRKKKPLISPLIS